MTWEDWLLMASMVLAIGAIIQAVLLRHWTKNETKRDLSFLTQLIINSASDPETVRKVVEDYNKNKQWRTEVHRRSDGKYILQSHQDIASRFISK